MKPGLQHKFSILTLVLLKTCSDDIKFQRFIFKQFLANAPEYNIRAHLFKANDVVS